MRLHIDLAYIQVSTNHIFRSEEVQSPDYYATFYHQTTGVITYFEARDQSNGTGGFVNYIYGGLQVTFVNVDFSLVKDAESSIDFVVEVWGIVSDNVLVPVADFRIGELTDRSAWDIRFVLEPYCHFKK